MTGKSMMQDWRPIILPQFPVLCLVKAVKGPGVSVPLRIGSVRLLGSSRGYRNRKDLTPAGETVLDFGQEITGWAEFLCDEEKEEKYGCNMERSFRTAVFYRDNLRTAKAEMTYISSGRKAVGPSSFYPFMVSDM